MSQQPLVQGRRSARRAKRRSGSLQLLAAAPAAASGGLVYPGYAEPDEDDSRRALVSGSLAAGLHLGVIALLFVLASLAPQIEERIIAVQLLRESAPEPEPAPEPSAAPRALAERRPLAFDPAVQAIEPQVLNPRVIAEASPVIAAEALEMDALSPSAAPREIDHRSVAVEHLSAIDSAAHVRASDLDVSGVTSPAVRGPTRIDAPPTPSAGPRRVEAAPVGQTTGTALEIGSGHGSSVREGVISNRDVIGSPGGALVVSVDTSIGDGLLGGNGSGAGGGGGSGTGAGSGHGAGGEGPPAACMQRSEVARYLGNVKERTMERWILPPGVDAGRRVTLRFQIDAAGSTSRVTILDAEDNALGASAVDALRAASPFPPMPDAARCLAQVPIVGTFSNPVGG